MSLTLETDLCIVRPWREADAKALPAIADNRKVWINLRDEFPHPYTAEDAWDWISFAQAEGRERFFAIESAGRLAGAIGLQPGRDIERGCAELGYWLGEPFWGRGIATAAARAVSAHAFDALRLHRVQAAVFEWNAASMRVLEKAGFRREGVMRRSAVKDGRVVDRVLYARVKD